MLKQQWSSTGPCSTGGLFYFVLNIDIPPVYWEMAICKHLQAPWNRPEREATAAVSHRGKMRQQGGRVSSPEVSAGLGFGSKGGLGALALLEEETLQQEEAECWSKLFSKPQTLMVEAEK